MKVWNDKRDPLKCFIIIYTCASTQGVILDLFPDGSAETLIISLKKFIARRGCLGGRRSAFVVDIIQKFVSLHNVKWDFSL